MRAYSQDGAMGFIRLPGTRSRFAQPVESDCATNRNGNGEAGVEGVVVGGEHPHPPGSARAVFVSSKQPVAFVIHVNRTAPDTW